MATKRIGWPSYLISLLDFINGYGYRLMLSAYWFLAGVTVQGYDSRSIVQGVWLWEFTHSLKVANACTCLLWLTLQLSPKAEREVSGVRYWKVSCDKLLYSVLRCVVSLCWCRWWWSGMWTLYTSTFIKYIKSISLF